MCQTLIPRVDAG